MVLRNSNSSWFKLSHLHYEVAKNGVEVNPVGYFYNDISSEQYEEILKLSSNPNQSFD